VIELLQAVLGQATLLDRVVFVGVAVAIGALVYVAATYLLRAEEPTMVVGLARRRLG